MDIEKFKALSDETRLRIINVLIRKELCVCEIEEVLGMSQSNVSRHLLKLKSVGIVESRKESQWTNYSISKKFIDENKHLHDHLKIIFEADLQFREDISKLKSLAPQREMCEVKR